MCAVWWPVVVTERADGDLGQSKRRTIFCGKVSVRPAVRS